MRSPWPTACSLADLAELTDSTWSFLPLLQAAHKWGSVPSLPSGSAHSPRWCLLMMPRDTAHPRGRAQRWALASVPQGQTVCSLSPPTMAGSWTRSELIKVIFPSKPLPRGLNTNEPPAQRRGLPLPSSAGQWLRGDSPSPTSLPGLCAGVTINYCCFMGGLKLALPWGQCPGTSSLSMSKCRRQDPRGKPLPPDQRGRKSEQPPFYPLCLA